MATVFFNEFHYDNAGNDSGEFIEIAGPAGTNLTGWKIVLYNGSNGASYFTINLSGTIPNQQNGYGTVSVAAVGLQNGAPDGFALVDASSTVVQFLSYEGAFTATNGPAMGMTSTDIGVIEADSTATGLSLQLKGSGTESGDFTWNSPSASSQAAVNSGQSFGSVVAQPGTLSIGDATAAEGNAGTTALSFTVSRTGGDDGAVSATWTATLPGGPGGADAADFAAGQVFTGTVSFADGVTSATVVLDVAGDTAFEPNETFTVALSAPTGGAVLGDASATDTILNDDAAPPAPPANVWINELHYDNASTDANEAIEIAGKAGTDLSGYQLVLYNGGSTAAEAANAVVYNTRTLSGLIDDEGAGYGAVSFAYPTNGIQNGAPDAVALIAPDGTVMQFFSYEGVVTAANGPAAGLTSTDLGVSEGGSGPATHSLQLIGNGASAGDFAWQAPALSSFGQLNTAQTIIADDATGLVSVSDTSVGEGDAGTTNLVFTVQRAGGLGQSASVDYTVVLDGSANAADLAAAVLSGTVTFAVGQASRTITVAVQGDLVGEPNETLSVVLSNPAGNIAIVDGTATGTIVNDDPLALTIPQIQGAAHMSAYAGQTVITQGVVTAIDTDGFWIQDAAGDGNAATSDGVFVFTDSAPSVLVGQLLSVEGTVEEFGFDGALSLTEIVTSGVTVISSGNALPAAVLIGQGGVLPPAATIEDDGFASFDPATDGIDFWESLEGMRVTIDAPQAVSNSNGFGEVDVVASLGASASGMNGSGGITISAGDFNPEKVQLDELASTPPGFVPSLTIGDQLADVTGVVNYAFDVFEVLVTAPVTVTQDTVLTRESTALAVDEAHLTMATFNLENLGADELSADPAIDDRFDILANDIVFSLGAPDIIAVQEIQDADGPGSGSNLSGQPTADALIQAVVDAGGPEYVYVEIAPATAGSTGGEPGGNIRNGYFYNPDRVDYLEGSASLITDSAFSGSRKPLTATFSFNGESFTAINVHLTSRLGSDPLWGDQQPPSNAGDAARTAQVAAVAAFISDQLATDSELEFAVMGDFNGFYFEPSLQQLDAAGLTNLATLLPAEERYSYLFEGNAQLLDNTYVSDGLLDGAAWDAVHRNSQFAQAPTDHDPTVTRLYLNVAPTALVLDDAEIEENAGAVTVVGNLIGTDTAGATLTYALVDDAGGLFAVDPETGAVTSTRPFDFEETASYAIVASVTDAGGETLTEAFAIAVTDVNEAPVAGDDTASVNEDAATGNLWAALLGNDADPDAGAELSIGAVDTSGTLGSVEFDADTQTLRYVADADAFDNLAPGETMTDSFTYTVVDHDGLSDTALVTVTVTGTIDGVTIDAGKGVDTVGGTDGEDELIGGQGADSVSGSAGHDILIGAQGDDYLIGGTGNDLLIGGQGADWLIGGDGYDGFAFGKSGGADRVLDFDPNEDRLELYDGIGIAGLFETDVNVDGVTDLVVRFTKGGGSATLLGVDADDALTVLSAGGPAEPHYAFSGGLLLPTLVDEPLF